jgi:hypothetical protein
MTANTSSVDTIATTSLEWPMLPEARGPLRMYVHSALLHGADVNEFRPTVVESDALDDGDFSLVLLFCYKSPYCGAVDGRWGWNPAFRRFAQFLSTRSKVAHPAKLPLRRPRCRFERLRYSRRCFMLPANLHPQSPSSRKVPSYVCELFIHRSVHPSSRGK